MASKYDLTGQIFGELKVLSYNVGTHSEFATWTCECSCGNTINVPGYALRAGNYKSCGCKRNEKRDAGVKKHIESDSVDGTRISSLQQKVHKDNKLGVKGVVWMENRNKYKAYIGYQGKQITLGYFDSLDDAITARKRGERQYHEPILERDQNDIKPKKAERIDFEPGTRFGKLVVIKKSHTEKRKRTTYHYYECKCDCGNTKTLEHYQLFNGFSKSCGCLKKNYILGAVFGDWEIIKEIDKKTRLCKCISCGKERTYRTISLYYKPKCNHKRKFSHKSQKKIKVTIDDFMLAGEAVRRWNITSYRLKDRIKVARNNGTMDDFIEKGWAKYSVGESESGTWILSKNLLEHWYGQEPIQTEKEEKDENN